jgi:methylmalonyl-CoA mutase N-terminal domain/subunit
MQILAHETGVPLVADPLAGSYYVEYLTNEIEKEATRILNDIEGKGGIIKAISSGWVEAEFEKSILNHQKEIESEERIIVGVNAFTSPPEEDILPGGVLRVPMQSGQEQTEKIRELKKERDNNKVNEAMRELHKGAQKGEKENLTPYVIKAVKANATVGEIMGTIREAYGYSYDPLNMRTSPFEVQK